MGMLPPSDSDSEEGSDAEPAPTGGQNPRMGMLPPSDSDSDDSDEDEEKSDAKPSKAPRPLIQEAPRRRKEDELDPEQLKVDMERLELVKQRREEQRLKRIAVEGWDRFAPMTETNRPPPPKDFPGKE